MPQRNMIRPSLRRQDETPGLPQGVGRCDGANPAKALGAASGIPARIRLYAVQYTQPRWIQAPMTTFDNRKDSFEKKFAHDEELRFKATARRNKLLGQWAAGLLGKAGADADAYAKTVVMSDFEEAGDDDVYRKVKADFDAAGVAQSEHQIKRTMDELMAQAIAEVQAGK